MSRPAIELQGVCKHYGKAEIIRNLSVRVMAGERLALVGPNGAGKSTLFDLISGRAKNDAGQILVNGRSIAGMSPFKIRRLGLARSFQAANIFHRMSVYDNVRCALLWPLGYRYGFWQRLNGLPDVRMQAALLLEKIGLQKRHAMLAGQLTYAEQKALELALTIAGGAEIILLDEPTAGMSRAEADVMAQLIRELTTDKTLLMVEHDMSVVFGLADRVAVLVNGEMIALDTPENVRSNARVQQAYLGPNLGKGTA